MESTELLIIGAGPHALSLMTRLMTPFPHALFSDEQQERLLEWRQFQQKSKKNISAQSESNLLAEWVRSRVKIIDPTGKWLSQWDHQFDAYEIKQLRSPVFFHPDPANNEALKAYAELHGRTSELAEYTADLFDKSVKDRRNGKKQKRQGFKTLFNERERQNFVIPSTRLFHDFCRDLIERHELQNAVTAGKVTQIIPEKNDEGLVESFLVSLEIGSEHQILRAKKVAVCVGMMNIPRFPAWVPPAEELNSIPENHLLHSKDLLRFIKSDIQSKLPLRIKERTNDSPAKLLVVGGGLTSAHLALLGSRSGFQKHFDASLPWVGRFKNVEFSRFYSTDNLQERLSMVKEARGGGSITPTVMNNLKTLQEQRVIDLCENCEIKKCEWDAERNMWHVFFTSSEQESHEDWFDVIWLATGCEANIHKEPLFRDLVSCCPAPSECGIPALTPELQWSEDCPNFFVTGPYAALQLGPNALNLIGGRAAAERISGAIWESWTDEYAERSTAHPIKEKIKVAVEEAAYNIFGHAGNYYSLLEIN